MLIRLLATAAFALVHYQVARSQAADASVQFVTVYESRGRHVKRSVQRLQPEHLNVKFQLGRTTVTLRLRRNTRVNRKIPVTFEGQTEPTQHVLLDENIAAYQDPESGAAIMVTFTDKDSDSRLTLDGIFIASGARYSITPESTPSTASRGTKHRVTRDHMGAVDVVHFNMPTADNISYAGMKKDESRRTKRASSSVYAAYHVELQFILDYTIWAFHLKNANGHTVNALSSLNYDFVHIFNMMDLTFRGIDGITWGYTIRLFFLGYHIAKSNESSSWTEQNVVHRGATVETTVVDSDKVLAAIEDWATQDGRSWGNPDHAMLFTRYNLISAKFDNWGITAKNGICRTRRSASAVEALGDVRVWMGAAKILSYNLGATQDGKTNMCLASDGYLTSSDDAHYPTPATISNTFKFSNCSIRDMGAVLDGTADGRPRVCLTNRVCDHAHSVEGGEVLPGMKYSLDEQCEIAFRKGYTFHKTSTNGDQDICRVFSCLLPQKTDFQNRNYGAMEGTPCGDNKCCRLGLCSSDCTVPTTEAPDPSCSPTGLALPVPSGCIDQHRAFTFNNKPYSCGEIVIISPEHCFLSSTIIPTNCCETCHKAGLAKQTQHYVQHDADVARDVTNPAPSQESTTTAFYSTTTDANPSKSITVTDAKQTAPPKVLPTRSSGETTTTHSTDTGSKAEASADGARDVTKPAPSAKTPTTAFTSNTTDANPKKTLNLTGLAIGASAAGASVLLVILATAVVCVVRRRDAVKRQTGFQTNRDTTHAISTTSFDLSPSTVNVIATPAILNEAFQPGGNDMSYLYPWSGSNESVHSYASLSINDGHAKVGTFMQPLPPPLPPRPRK